MTTTPWDPDKYLAALRFSAKAHRDQKMPGELGLPYAVHVSMVAMEVCAALSTQGVMRADLAVQAALLHDTVEDTDTSYEDLVDVFGVDVASGVRALSKRPGLSKADAMRDSLRRIRTQPHEIWMVKLADRITNLQSPPEHWSLEKRRRYCDEAEEILATLGAAHDYLASRLAAKISHYRMAYC